MKGSIFIIMLFCSTVCAKQRFNADDPITIMRFLEDNSSFQTLKGILMETVLDQILSKKGLGDYYTIFAPTDKAFSQFGRLGLLRGKEQDDKDRFKEFVNYHVVRKKYTRKQLKVQDRGLKTLVGERLKLDEIGRIEYSIDLNNGIIHVIDHVLINPKLKEFLYGKE